MRPPHTSLIAAAALMGAAITTTAAVPVPATVDNAVALAARGLDYILGVAPIGQHHDTSGGGSVTGQAPVAQDPNTVGGNVGDHDDGSDAHPDAAFGDVHAYTGLDIS